MRQGLIPGHNVDRVNIHAGLIELNLCGYSSAETCSVVAYALQRHARGEEDAARYGAIDERFHGVNLTTWLRVLAAARAAA